MNENESIDDMITKFTKITNSLTSLGDKIDNDQKVSGDSCTSTVLGGQVYNLEGALIGNLKTHEVEKKAREEKAPQKKKTLAFKSTPISDDEDDDQEDDKDLSLLVKNVRMIYNKVKFNNRRRWQGKEDKKIICYNCRKSGYTLLSARRPKVKPQPPRSPTKIRPLRQYEIRRATPKKRWIRLVCIHGI